MAAGTSRKGTAPAGWDGDGDPREFCYRVLFKRNSVQDNYSVDGVRSLCQTLGIDKEVRHVEVVTRKRKNHGTDKCSVYTYFDSEEAARKLVEECNGQRPEGWSKPLMLELKMPMTLQRLHLDCLGDENENDARPLPATHVQPTNRRQQHRMMQRNQSAPNGTMKGNGRGGKIGRRRQGHSRHLSFTDWRCASGAAWPATGSVQGNSSLPSPGSLSSPDAARAQSPYGDGYALPHCHPAYHAILASAASASRGGLGGQDRGARTNVQRCIRILSHSSAAVSQLRSVSRPGTASEDWSTVLSDSDAESVRAACIHVLRSALGEGSIVPDVSMAADDDTLWAAWYGSSASTEGSEGSMALVATTNDSKLCRPGESTTTDSQGGQASEQDCDDKNLTKAKGQEQLKAQETSSATCSATAREERNSVGAVLGCCTVRRSRAGRGTNIAEISVVVAPSHRRQGVGTQLLAASLVRAADMGYAAVCTPPVAHTDTAALTILARAGFQQVGAMPAALPLGPDAAADLLTLHLALARAQIPHNAAGASADVERTLMATPGTCSAQALTSAGPLPGSIPDIAPSRGPFRHIRAHSQPFANAHGEAGFGAGLSLHNSATLHSPIPAATRQSDVQHTSNSHLRGASIGTVEEFSALSAVSGMGGTGLSVHAASWLQQQQQQ